ncbi:hypothetical protein HYPSUDRAFT_321427 [Hypholoma sublateritium FD-334 SS-4]|uniref:Uncharacterized protein n=1 Tax=Hypholoma sublateritium (strain FD-334 SS-4) TaxID=945553 RepID=A0A0D2NHM9_HYPSF|nr:hypothetical protein HYPSUDRAFT_321427 [Hypholoma sublateritium FD-334 SS-4]
MMHGIAMPPTGNWTMPLYDERLLSAVRVSSFKKWVTSYFPRPALKSRSPFRVSHSSACAEPSISCAYTQRSNTGGIRGYARFVGGGQGESSMGNVSFWPPAVNALAERTLFSKEVRNLWDS